MLSALFRHALQTGKRVRTETGISKGTTSFAYAAVTVARGQDQAGLRGARVVVVGAGDMGLGVCRALSDIAAADAPARVVVANRSSRRARDLVRASEGSTFEMRAVPLEHVGAELVDADVVLSAVAAESHVLEASDFERCDRSAARHRPRGPAQRRSGGGGTRGRHAARHGHAGRLGGPGSRRPPGGVGGAAHGIVAAEVERFRTASRQRGAAPVIASLRARSESLRVAELERHRAQLADLTEEEWEHVDAATRAALAKMLHEPTMLLKETAGTPRGERLVEALRILFDL